MPLNPKAISLATACPLLAVETNWRVIVKALEEQGIMSDLMEVAAAATIAVETAHTFLPINEFGGSNPIAYFTKHYENRADLGNTHPGDGARFHGRGWPQLTGRDNYLKFGQLVGVDLIADPDKALDPSISAEIFALFALEKRIDHLAKAQDWMTIRKRWNGVNKATGMPNGWDDFNRCVRRLLLALGGNA